MHFWLYGGNGMDELAVQLLESCIHGIMAQEHYSNADCAGMLKLFHAREYLLDAESDFERARR
jgi:hypothetical protein